mgnify:CR=1 FL=1
MIQNNPGDKVHCVNDGDQMMDGTTKLGASVSNYPLPERANNCKNKCINTDGCKYANIWEDGGCGLFEEDKCTIGTHSWGITSTLWEKVEA